MSGPKKSGDSKKDKAGSKAEKGFRHVSENVYEIGPKKGAPQDKPFSSGLSGVSANDLLKYARAVKSSQSVIKAGEIKIEPGKPVIRTFAEQDQVLSVSEKRNVSEVPSRSIESLINVTLLRKGQAPESGSSAESKASSLASRVQSNISQARSQIEVSSSSVTSATSASGSQIAGDQQEAVLGLRRNLSTLTDLHVKLKFLLQELEQYVQNE